ncbi:MAG: phage baseplate upper protein [Tetragenococcus sp.]|nr:phage baseplate upper protein [Tetragenococcus sp.]
MPVLKKGEIKVRATAYGTEVKSTGYVFYSYDKNSSALFFQFRNQNGEPTDIANAKIHLLMILEDDEGKEFIPGQEDFEIISKPGGKAKFVLPEMLLSYQGKVAGYINLDFEDGSHTDEGQFSFRIRRSMITRVLPAMGDKYVQDFEDIKERVEQAADDSRNNFNDSVERVNKAETKAKSDMQDSVDQVNKDYEAWKSEQEEEQTGFERDFADWKNTQETKQTNFESETSQKITDINQTLETTDSQVQETNNALENLDAYTKVETDEKLKEKADKEEVGKTVDDIFEQGYLELEKGFENYYENETEKTDRDSTLLKYTRVGPLLHVFGIITNTVRLEEGSSTIVTYIPDHLKVASRDVKVSQGSENNLFTSMALSYENDRYTNAITIERLRDDTGNNTGYNPGKFLNISLTFTVEVVK